MQKNCPKKIMLAITSNQKHFELQFSKGDHYFILGFSILVIVLLLFSRTSQNKVTTKNYGIGLHILTRDSKT
jgi:hypothetical protein